MATFLNDTFTDVNGTALASHTGETGATWTKHPNAGASNIAVSNINTIVSDGTTLSYYYASGTPAGAEYDVTSDLLIKSTTASRRAGVMARLATDAATYYRAYYENQVEWVLIKNVAGSSTNLGTWSEVIADEDTRAFVFEVRDATKKLFVAGVERISSTDNDITAAGRVGVMAGGSMTNTAGVHLGSVTATDAVTSITGSGTPALGTVSLAAASIVKVAGTGAPALPSPVSTAQGTVALTGTGTPALGTITLSANGTLPLAGAGAPALGTVTVASASTLLIAADSAPALGALLLTSTATLVVTADSALVLGEPSLSATGELEALQGSGSAALTLGEPSLAAESGLTVSADAESTIGPLAVSGTATIALGGQAAIVLEPLLLSATGVEGSFGERLGVGVLVLPGLQTAATGNRGAPPVSIYGEWNSADLVGEWSPKSITGGRSGVSLIGGHR